MYASTWTLTDANDANSMPIAEGTTDYVTSAAVADTMADLDASRTAREAISASGHAYFASVTGPGEVLYTLSDGSRLRTTVERA